MLDSSLASALQGKKVLILCANAEKAKALMKRLEEKLLASEKLLRIYLKGDDIVLEKR